MKIRKLNDNRNTTIVKLKRQKEIVKTMTYLQIHRMIIQDIYFSLSDINLLA